MKRYIRASRTYTEYIVKDDYDYTGESFDTLEEAFDYINEYYNPKSLIYFNVYIDAYDSENGTEKRFNSQELCSMLYGS